MFPRLSRLLLVSMLLCAVPAFAQTEATANADTQAQIDATNAQIQRLKDEIAALQNDLNATTAQKQTLQNAIKTLDLQIQKLQKSVSLTSTQITQKDKEIGKLSGTIEETTGRIGEARGGVAESLRELQQMDEEALSTALFGGATLSSFFDEAVTLSSLRSNLQNRIGELAGLKQNLEQNKQSAEGKRKELSNLKSNLTQQKQGVTIAKTNQATLLAETKNKESAYQALIAQKRAEESHFEDVLYQLAVQLGTADISHIPAPGSAVLSWPLDSIFITQQFGKTSSSGRLYASGTHNGVDFRASLGTPIRAALSGVVQEINQGAVKNCQYGKWVLIKHADGLATLYGHLSSINVTKGQTVSTGEMIGLSGDTGYATGPHLHLTVFAATAVTFKQYSCASGYSTLIPVVPVNAYLDPLSYLPAR
ncbi:hypothetical protein EXS62_02720 [Candidatus Kaiserbacteria bacterium]|nr:hypothetical protein [Candidatus Kaiserbacteria bacterium]